MTYKDKIKEEIERRMNNLWYLIPEGEKVLKDAFTKDDANNLGKYTALENLLQFIDSLPEEPKCIYNRTLEERKKFCKYCSAACDVRIEEELVGEDLEEEIKRCWNEMFPIGWSDTTLLTLTHEGHAAFARHYAEWQEKKMLGIAEAFYEQGNACRLSSLPARVGSEWCRKYCNHFGGTWLRFVGPASYVRCKHPEAKDSEGCGEAIRAFYEELEHEALCALCN